MLGIGLWLSRLLYGTVRKSGVIVEARVRFACKDSADGFGGLDLRCILAIFVSCVSTSFEGDVDRTDELKREKSVRDVRLLDRLADFLGERFFNFAFRSCDAEVVFERPLFIPGPLRSDTDELSCEDFEPELADIAKEGCGFLETFEGLCVTTPGAQSRNEVWARLYLKMSNACGRTDPQILIQ